MKLSVGLRLGVQTGVAVLLCTVIGYFGLRGLRTVTTTVEEMTITNTALYHHLQGDMMHDALRADVFGAFLAENPADAKQVMADTLEHSAEFRKMVQLNSELRLNAEVAQAIEAIKPKLDEYIKGAQAMVDLALHDRAAAKARLPQFLNLFGELEDLQASASERISNSAARAGHEEEKVIGQTQTTMFAVGAACLVFLAGIGYWTYRVILIPLRSCLSVLTECSKGNLSCRTEWKSSDEFGVLASVTNMLTQNFSNMIGEVQQSAIAVASAATEIASSANEMSCAVDDVAKQTTRTSESASESGRIAKDGGEVVRQTVEGMQQINSAVNASAASVTELGNRGREIGEIISVINGIADQTNLLALNAAIEAARAGEHGRGFAVVADEVRKLAERTSKATEEVGESIKAIQKETDEAVQRMNTGTEQVKLGVDLATQAGASLQQIVSGAGDVAGMVQSISAAAEQAGAGARQSADAATQLSGKAERLQSLVSRFQLAATR